MANKKVKVNKVSPLRCELLRHDPFQQEFRLSLRETGYLVSGGGDFSEFLQTNK